MEEATSSSVLLVQSCVQLLDLMIAHGEGAARALIERRSALCEVNVEESL